MDKFAILLNLLYASSTFICNAEEEGFKCPEKQGVFEDSIQCDKYYKCEKGVATEQLCPDGLVFNPTTNKCDYPFLVDCEDRPELQDPQPTPLCPRRNGIFPHPDETVCNVYYICADGKSSEMICSKGLYFDKFGGGCVTPESAGRSECEHKEVLVIP